MLSAEHTCLGAAQEERNRLDEQMMRSVRRATRDAEAVLFLIDAGDRPEQALPLLQPYCGRGLPVAVVLNKARGPASPLSLPYTIPKA
jgi:GTPase Era involved in 16S rRNA processing